MTAPNIYRGSTDTAGIDSEYCYPVPPFAGRPSRTFSGRSLSPDDHAIGYERVSPTIPVMVHLGAGADHVDFTSRLISLPDIE